MKCLGVIGGLGPMATALFYQMVTEMTEARTDQEHIELLIHSCPKISDRSSYILGTSRESPAVSMAAVGRKLAEHGADFIVVPCITAGCFYQELSEQIPVPVMDNFGEIAWYLKDRQISKIGLMAADGTVKAGLLQKELELAGMKVLVPEEKEQQDVMHLIYQDVKAGRLPEPERFFKVIGKLKDAGAQKVLLGCTELSVIARQLGGEPNCMDALAILARRTVQLCGKLGKSYEI